MKITITLTTAEEKAIRAYLAEVEGTDSISKDDVESEVKTRLYHALRDPRESISDYVTAEEKTVLMEGGF